MSTGLLQGDAVCAVIVTHNPDKERLNEIIDVVSRAVSHVVIVDNGSEQFHAEELCRSWPEVRISTFGENRGIGAAQNEGIAVARTIHAAYVLFLDQDSVPEKGMVAALRSACDRLVAKGEKIACVGPRVRLPGSDNLSVFRRIGWFGLHPVVCADRNTFVECDYLISSGSLTPIAVFDEVGSMEARLFIDQVDTEWCLRARAKGYKVYGVCGAVLRHRLGESHTRFWLGRWRRLPRHKPFRYYYIFRNTVLLCRRDYVSLKYALFQVKWLVALFLMYGVFTRERNGELHMMFKGVKDGMLGVTGKLASA